MLGTAPGPGGAFCECKLLSGHLGKVTQMEPPLMDADAVADVWWLQPVCSAEGIQAHGCEDVCQISS